MARSNALGALLLAMGALAWAASCSPTNRIVEAAGASSSHASSGHPTSGSTSSAPTSSASSTSTSASGAGGASSSSSSSTAAAGGASSASTSVSSTSSATSSGSCTLTPCPSGCVDTTQDQLNCGTCGHSCLGGMCMASVCQPWTLALGQLFPTGLSQDATSLYWGTQNGTVEALTKATGTLRNIATGQGATATASDGTNVYWFNGGSTTMFSAPAAGMGAVTMNFPGMLNGTQSMRLTPSNNAMVYSDMSAEYLTALPPAGTPNIISGTPSPYLACNDMFAYIIDAGGTIDAIGIAGGLSGGIGPIPVGSAYLALYGSTLYFGYSSQVMTMPTAGAPMAMPLTTDPNGSITGIFADAQGVYWTDAMGMVMQVPLAGGTPVMIWKGENPTTPLADATAIYWADLQANTIMAVAK